jgi:protein LTV1
MGKKKPFIDKKNSSTYHVLHRSQRDVADGEDQSGNVLWPSDTNNRETDQKVLLNQKKEDLDDATLGTWKQQLSHAGLVDDYDYDKHMKPITGTGDFFDASGKRSASASADVRALNVKDEIVNEVDRQLDSIALTPDCMDDEIAQALFGDFDEGDFEELNDEFVLDASKQPENDGNDEDDQGFDFAAHIQGLMDKARMVSDGTQNLGTIHEQGQNDQAFFSSARALGEDDDEDSGLFDENNWKIEGTPGIVPKLNEAAEKALCDKFNATLAEYDSDDMGEGYDDDDVLGDRPLEGDTQVEAALDDFIEEQNGGLFMQHPRHYREGLNNGGSGFSALVGTKMIPLKDLDETAPVRDIRPIEDVLGEASDVLGSGKAAPPAEEVLIDGQSYFSEKMRNPWDCESILTTYSNLDNNPVTIGPAGRRRRRKNKKGISSDESIAEEESVKQIILSEKTGLPLGVLPTREQEGGADTYISVNKGQARQKTETADEKKLRKINVKKEREMARMQKKMMKEAFNEEFSKRAQEVLVDDVGGQTVFRF